METISNSQPLLNRQHVILTPCTVADQRRMRHNRHDISLHNHTSTPPLCFLRAGCPSCRPTNSVKALEAYATVDQRFLFSCQILERFICTPSRGEITVEIRQHRPSFQIWGLLCRKPTTLRRSGSNLAR